MKISCSIFRPDEYLRLGEYQEFKYVCRNTKCESVSVFTTVNIQTRQVPDK